jgi:D-inositol-3-phosphate glycosyltransferase
MLVVPITRPLSIAMVSMHTSPLESPGSGDAGGMNVVERHTAEALGELGHRVELITRRSDPDQPDVVDLGGGVTVRHIDAGPATRLPKSAIDAYVDEFRASMSNLGPYDIVHSHHWMSGMAALPLARVWGVPHVQSYHSVAALPGDYLSEGEPPESTGRVAGEALLATESDLVIAISAAEARTVVARCGADPNRVMIIPPGVDDQLFRPLAVDEPKWTWPHERGPACSKGYILYAARLQPLKGPDLAIAALGQVPEELRPHLVVAGEVSADFASYADELEAMVERLNLGEYVTFKGSQSRSSLAEMLRGARLCLVPSHSETFGLIALESAASGTPVIASAAGGLREAVVHGETGQLMDSRLAIDWASAMIRLLADPELLARMGTVARIHARRFSWHTTAQCLTESYEKLLGSVHASPGFLTRPLDLPPEFAAVKRSGDLHADGHV